MTYHQTKVYWRNALIICWITCGSCHQVRSLYASSIVGWITWIKVITAKKRVLSPLVHVPVLVNAKLVVSFFVFNATRFITLATISQPKLTPFVALNNFIRPQPTYTKITGSLVLIMNMFNTYFNEYCTNIQWVLSKNTLKNTAKNTPNVPRIAAGWLDVIEWGHILYQIESKGISDSKARLYLSKKFHVECHYWLP